MSSYQHEEFSSNNDFYLSEPSISEDDRSREFFSDDTKSAHHSPNEYGNSIQHRKDILRQYKQNLQMNDKSKNLAMSEHNVRNGDEFSFLIPRNEKNVANHKHEEYISFAQRPNFKSMKPQLLHLPSRESSVSSIGSPNMYTSSKHFSFDMDDIDEVTESSYSGNGNIDKQEPNNSSSNSQHKQKESNISNTGHRRKRSGDDAAAILMTGGNDWKGMAKDGLPIPKKSPIRPSSVEDDDDEEDEEEDAELENSNSDMNADIVVKRGKKLKFRKSGMISNIGILQRKLPTLSKVGLSRNVSHGSIDYSDTGESAQTQNSVLSWITGKLSTLSELLPHGESEVDVEDDFLFENVTGISHYSNPEHDKKQTIIDKSTHPNNVISPSFDSPGFQKSHLEDLSPRKGKQNLEKTTNKMNDTNMNMNMNMNDMNRNDHRRYQTFACPNCGIRQRRLFSFYTHQIQPKSFAPYVCLYLAANIFVATLSFRVDEGWNLLDCIYFSVITFTTTGLGDYVPTTLQTKVITMISSYFGWIILSLFMGSVLVKNQKQQQMQQKLIENCFNCGLYQYQGPLFEMQRQSGPFIRNRRDYGSLGNRQNIEEDPHSRTKKSEHSNDEENVVDLDESMKMTLIMDKKRSQFRRAKISKAVSVIFTSILFIIGGAFAFHHFEGLDILSSLYFTTSLWTTVGYGDIVPTTNAGKIFTVFYTLVAGLLLFNNISLLCQLTMDSHQLKIDEDFMQKFGGNSNEIIAFRKSGVGPIVRRLQQLKEPGGDLNECTHEKFALAMLVRLGRITEQDIEMSFCAYDKLGEASININDNIFGKHKQNFDGRVPVKNFHKQTNIENYLVQ